MLVYLLYQCSYVATATACSDWQRDTGPLWQMGALLWLAVVEGE
jgi:hypothetical protein